MTDTTEHATQNVQPELEPETPATPGNTPLAAKWNDPSAEWNRATVAWNRG